MKINKILAYFIIFVSLLLDLKVLAINSVARTVVVDNNNKVVAAGFFSNDFNNDFTIARYNDDGSLDTTFNPNGPQPGVVGTNITFGQVQTTTNQFLNDVINDIVIDNNNKIVAVGTTNNGFISDFVVARYNEDGSLDATFNPTALLPAITGPGLPPVAPGMGTPGIVIGNIGNLINNLTIANQTNDIATSVVIDNNNKIVVAGYTAFDANSSVFVARFNEDGTLDTTFNTGGTGSVIPGGLISGIPGIVLTNLLGVNTVGGIQNPFQFLAEKDIANSVAIDNNNKIVVGGSANNGLFESFLIIRYNEDGSLDTTFNPIQQQLIAPGAPGVVLTNILNEAEAFDIKIDNNNKIVAVGSATDTTTNTTQFALTRYNENGSLDTTFNAGLSTMLSTTIFLNNNLQLTLLAPGIILTNLSNNISIAKSFVIDNNNMIVVTGPTTGRLQSTAQFSSFGGPETNFFTVRYNTNGSIDTTFNQSQTPGFTLTSIQNILAAPGQFNNSQPYAITLDNNNKLIIAGSAEEAFENNFALARLNDDGTLDTSFNPVGIQPGTVVTNINNGFSPLQDIFLGASNSGTPLDLLDRILLNPYFTAELSSELIGFFKPTITNPEDGFITNQNAFSIEGTAHPGANIILLINSINVAQTQTDLEGRWFANTPILADGTYQISAKTTDNISRLDFDSNTIIGTIQATPLPIIPAAPTDLLAQEKLAIEAQSANVLEKRQTPQSELNEQAESSNSEGKTSLTAKAKNPENEIQKSKNKQNKPQKMKVFLNGEPIKDVILNGSEKWSVPLPKNSKNSTNKIDYINFDHKGRVKLVGQKIMDNKTN